MPPINMYVYLIKVLFYGGERLDTDSRICGICGTSVTHCVRMRVIALELQTDRILL